jgi:Uma2 family endonuclease
MDTQAGLVTVAEFLRLPDPKEGHYELRHGEVVLVPPPKWEHHLIQLRIQMLIMSLVRGLGIVGVETPFRPTPEHEVWVADVAFILVERVAAIPKDAYLEGSPDLVAEVLSPGNTADEINDRMSICLDNGCRSFWVADPKRRRLSVTEGDITRHYAIDSYFHCDVLGAMVSVREIFE